MRRLLLILLWALGAALSVACRGATTQPPRSPGIEQFPQSRDLHAFAERYRTKHGLVALGVGVIHRGQVAGLGMAGERRRGSGDWATLDDAFDVASISKSVTATIAAMLVRDGVVRWNSTPAELFPEARHRFHPGYATATLERLLQHRAGVDHTMNRNDRWAGWQRAHSTLPPLEQRRQFTFMVLEKPPRSTPGSESFYTSDGYIMAGSMLERAAGIEWTELVRLRLLEPLALHSMTFESASQGIATVLGHEPPRWFGLSRPVPNDPAEYGILPFGAPAGFLRSSVPDLLRYLDFHMRGDSGTANLLLPQEAFQRLHRADPGEQFALGWESEVQTHPSSGTTEHSVYHGGYSGRARANVWFVPETGWGTAIVTNDGKGDASLTADIFYGLLAEFGLHAASSGP